jgi:hypothetical protein
VKIKNMLLGFCTKKHYSKRNKQPQLMTNDPKNNVGSCGLWPNTVTRHSVAKVDSNSAISHTHV